MTDRCPSFGRLMHVAVGEQVAVEDRGHLSKPCTYCQLTLAVSFSHRCPSPALAHDSRAIGGALGAALDEHVAGGCLDCSRSRRPASTVPASSPKRPGSQPLARERGRRRRLVGGLAATLAAVTSLVVLAPMGQAAVCRGDVAIEGAGHGGGALTGQRVVVAAVWEGQEQADFARVLQGFEERTGAEVRYDPVGHDIASVIGKRIEAKCPVDVVLLPQPGLLRDLARRGDIKPIEQAVGEVVNQNYTPVWRELGTVDGSLYGVWFKAANKSMIWYDAPLFERLGIGEPQTWDDLKRAAEKILRETGMAPFSVGAAQGWVLTDIWENIYLQTAGPDLYDDLASHRIPWTDGSVTRALELFADVFGRPEWLAGGIEGALRTSYEESVAQVFPDLLQQPQPIQHRAAMVFEGDFVANLLRPGTVGREAKAFDFPVIDSSESTVTTGTIGRRGTGGDVAAMVTDREAGKEFLRYLATPEAAAPWAAAGGFVSPNKQLSGEVYRDDISRRSSQLLANAETLRYDLSDLQPSQFGSTAGKGMWKIFQDYLGNRLDVDATAAALADERARAPVNSDSLAHRRRGLAPLRPLLVGGVLSVVVATVLVLLRARRFRKGESTQTPPDEFIRGRITAESDALVAGTGARRGDHEKG